MLTDQEMLIIAERYLKSKGEHFGEAEIKVMEKQLTTERVRISETEENFMDYRLKSSGSFNTNCN